MSSSSCRRGADGRLERRASGGPGVSARGREHPKADVAVKRQVTAWRKMLLTCSTWRVAGSRPAHKMARPGEPRRFSRLTEQMPNRRKHWFGGKQRCPPPAFVGTRFNSSGAFLFSAPMPRTAKFGTGDHRRSMHQGWRGLLPATRAERDLPARSAEKRFPRDVRAGVMTRNGGPARPQERRHPPRRERRRRTGCRFNMPASGSLAHVLRARAG